MLHLEVKWPSKQNILIAEKFWQNQVRSQVLRFEGGKILFKVGKIFVFIICLKQIFLSTKTLGGTQNRFGGNVLRMPPVSAGLGMTIARKSSIGGLYVCAGGLDIPKIYF